MYLPNETLLLIGQHIDPLIKKPNYLELARVCRHWYSLFTPQLYSDIRIDASQLPALVRSVHENPRLGTYIRRFILRWWDSWDEEEGDYDPELLRFLAKKASHSLEEAEKWKTSLEKTNTDAWFAVLLMYMPNMTTLDIDHSGNSDFVKRMLCRAAYREKPFDRIPGLQNLETVRIPNEDRNKAFYPACEIVPFFHLPKVRFLQGETVIENEYDKRDDHPAQKAAKGTSPIQRIKFNNCNGRKGFTEFIASCANLQEFEYQHSNQEIWGETYIGFRPCLFYKALLTQKHSLQVLRLNDGGDHEMTDMGEEGEEEEDSHPDDWFGSLKEFIYLRELRIRIRNLFDYGRENKTPSLSLQEILPSSLEYLVLANYDVLQYSVINSNLHELLSRREEFPNLRKIEIQPGEAERIYPAKSVIYWKDNFQAPIGARESFREIERVCGEVGVEFGYCFGGMIRVLS